MKINPVKAQDQTTWTLDNRIDALRTANIGLINRLDRIEAILNVCAK